MPEHVLTVINNYRLDDITCRHDRRVYILRGGVFTLFFL